MWMVTLIIFGIAFFAIGIILVFNPFVNKTKKGQRPFPDDIEKLKSAIEAGLQDIKLSKRAVNDALLHNRVFRDEIREGLSTVLSSNKKFEDELQRQRQLADDNRAKQEAYIKENSTLKEAIERLTKEISSQKDSLQRALHEKGTQLEAFKEELRKAKIEIASSSQDIGAGKKALNDALNQNKIFNYKLKEDLRVVLSENEGFKRELQQEKAVADNFRARHEAVLKEELSRLRKEASDQKGDFQRALDEKRIQLEAFERELEETKKQVFSGLQNIEAARKAINGALTQNRVFQDEVKDKLLAVLSDNERLKVEIDKENRMADGFRLRQEAILKESGMLKEKIEHVASESKRQKDDLEAALNERYARLKSFEKDLEEARRHVEERFQDIKTDINEVLAKGRSLGDEVRDKLVAVSSENEKLKDELNQQKKTADDYRLRQEEIIKQKETALKETIEHLAKEINAQKADIFRALNGKFTRLKAFDEELQKMKRQLAGFMNYSRDKRDWKNDIEEAAAELLKIKSDISKQDSMIQDTKKEIEEIKSG